MMLHVLTHDSLGALVMSQYHAHCHYVITLQRYYRSRTLSSIYICINSWYECTEFYKHNLNKSVAEEATNDDVPTFKHCVEGLS